jgi:hypothetical protein
MAQGQTKYHKTYLSLHRQYETFAYPIFKKALDKQIDVALSLIDAENLDNIDLYITYLPGEPIKKALEEVYPPVGESAAKFSFKYIQATGDKMAKKDLSLFFNKEWIQKMVDYLLLNAAEKIKGITDTTIKSIRKVIADSAMMNLSRVNQAKYIQETLNNTAFNRDRSLLIARTESTTAANVGISIGAESSDYYVNKIWIATNDKRTRMDHRIAEMQEPIPPDSPFIVGGNEMMYPGDVSAPADQVCNCRCVMGTVILKDEDGLPILKPRKTAAERQMSYKAAKTYNDYPESAVNNAKRALRFADENGWGSCGTPVGKARARQLANRENLSRDTIARMASFKRHQQYKDVPYTEGCGGLMWDAWGGTSGVEWAISKLKEIDNQ